MKQRKTTNQIAWDKEQKRIKQFIREATKRGFDFSDFVIPKKPKRITKKQLELIRSIKPDFLYSKATYKAEKGVISGLEGRKLERRTAYSKRFSGTRNKAGIPPTDVDDVLRQVEKIIDEYNGNSNWGKYMAARKNRDYQILKRIFFGALARDGRRAVAKRLQANANRVIDIVNEALYASDQETVNFAMAAFARIVKGEALTIQEAIEIQDASEGYGDETSEG